MEHMQRTERQPLPEVNVKFKRATLERAEKFISNTYFTDVNLRGRLYPDKEPLVSIVHCGRSERFQPPSQAKDGRGEIKTGESFGPTWATHWFRLTAVVPQRFAGEEVRLRWNSGCEAMVYSLDLEPLQGLTELGGQERTDFVLTKTAAGGEKYEFYVEMACNAIFGAGDEGMINAPDPNRSFALAQCELAVFDRRCAALCYDLEILVDMASKMDDRYPRSYQALYTTNAIVNACRVGDHESYDRCHIMATEFLQQHNGQSQLTIAAMANCHIDCAWLWTYEETIRKCARSFASTLRLMEDYPDLTFACSQAQQYEWVKTHYPSLYERMKKSIANGKFIPVGGSWVEMDANMPSGESMARQFIVGQKFFKQEFGHYCQVFWLPDTFGYASQLPQLMTLAGMKYFLTQKISWNLLNKFPHHSFKWEGLDGTQVLVHFPPAETYGAHVNVEEALKTVTNLEDKGRVAESIMLYGHGDGGGGPTEDMLERMERLKDCDGLPRIRPSTPLEFFSRLEETSSSQLCTWVGEMYLELHNATYTSQAETKRANRVGEFLLRDAETTSALAHLFHVAEYPQEELLRIWKLFLLNQFHDILPGSSIESAHDLAKDYYTDVFQSAKAIHSSSFISLLKMLSAGGSDATVSSQPAMAAIFNPFPWQRQQVCVVGDHIAVSDDVIVQETASGHKLALMEVPSVGVATGSKAFTAAHGFSASVSDDGDGGFTMSNGLLRAQVTRDGQLSSLVILKTGKEAIPTGQTSNRLVMFDDVPLFWDAWDVMPYHLETRRVLTGVSDMKVVETGPLRVAVQFQLKISDKSHLVQTIVLNCNEEFVRFNTEVEWQENRQFLKVEFPVDITSMEAVYESPFGHTRRPTHSNTSWDVAKFELCGHKWCDYSEYDFGVAVMTDSKYGYSARNKMIRISLLRAPKAPDANCDMGRHQFSYAVFPHHGSFQSAGVIQQSYNFNHPLAAVPSPRSSTGGDVVSWLTCSDPAVILEAIKKPEDSNSSSSSDGSQELVLRFYEAFGSHASATVQFSFGDRVVTAATLCNLLEEEINATSHLPVTGQSVKLQLTPFQVVTLKLAFSDQ